MIAFKDAIVAYALYYPAVDLLSSVAIALVVWRGGFGVLHLPTVTIGVLIMFTQFSLRRFWRPIQDLSDKFNILQAAMAACERIFKLLDSQPEIVSPARPATDGSNRIEFQHVWFTYQKADGNAESRNRQGLQPPAISQAQKVLYRERDFSHAAERLKTTGLWPVPDASTLAAIASSGLENISFTVEAGKTVAISHTGAGKTTLTSLMMRFYDTAGRILVDSVDLRDLV